MTGICFIFVDYIFVHPGCSHQTGGWIKRPGEESVCSSEERYR